MNLVVNKHKGRYKQVGTVIDDTGEGKPTAFVLAKVGCSCGGTGVIGRKTETANIARVGRNDRCVCGSGKKYKKCCMMNEVGSLGDPIPCGCVITSPVNIGHMEFK